MGADIEVLGVVFVFAKTFLLNPCTTMPVAATFIGAAHVGWDVVVPYGKWEWLVMCKGINEWLRGKQLAVLLRNMVRCAYN